MTYDAKSWNDAAEKELARQRAPGPVVTVNYPHPVRLAAEPQFLVNNDATPLFMDNRIDGWERPLCAQLDPSKRYRLELRFFEVDE